jgi:hypothetical protein
MENIDVYRAAQLLIKQHGALGAEIHAAQRADEMLEAGDMEGRRVWQRVVEAVRELSDTKPPGDGVLVH